MPNKNRTKTQNVGGKIAGGPDAGSIRSLWRCMTHVGHRALRQRGAPACLGRKKRGAGIPRRRYSTRQYVARARTGVSPRYAPGRATNLIVGVLIDNVQHRGVRPGYDGQQGDHHQEAVLDEQVDVFAAGAAVLHPLRGRVHHGGDEQPQDGEEQGPDEGDDGAQPGHGERHHDGA